MIYSRKKLFWGLVVMVLAAILAGCTSSYSGGPSGQQQENAQQSADTTQLVTSLPVPDFSTSEIRKNLIEVEAIEALGVKSTSFALTNNGNLLWSCPSEGLPIPVTDELTNPDQLVWNSAGTDGVASGQLAQMDPNGIYQGDGTGTDVLCLDSNGDPYVHYWEGYVDSVTANATWNKSDNQVVVQGTPVTPDCVIKTKNHKQYEACSVPENQVVSSTK